MIRRSATVAVFTVSFCSHGHARNALGLKGRKATRLAWLFLVSVPALSLDANAVPGDISCNLRDEIAGRVIDIRFECARLRVAVLS